ncbi:MAG: thrombospondin type 3 repeat-containing protein [Dehalococcoidia bacterium]
MYFASPHRIPIARTLLVGAIALAVAVVALIGNGAPPASAAFHCMRVGAVMGGANGNADIQYVELRMNAGGQNLVGGHTIRFRDATGVAQVTFTFPTNVGGAAMGASILIATAEFDAVASVNPDFLFSDGTVIDPDTLMTVPSNTTGVGDRNHPVQAPDGKVSFEEASTSCLAAGPPVDSVAYGTGYSGTVDYGSAVNVDLPITGKQAIVVDNLGLTPDDNSMEYSLQTIPEPIPPPSGPNTPRNNGGATGDIGGDADGDGVDDSVDNCPNTVNPDQENDVHPGTTAGDHCEDPDSDGDMDIADNCPDNANADQRNTDGDGLGDVCDLDVDGDAILNTSDIDDDGDNYLDADETSKGSDTINPGSTPEHCEGTDDDGDTVIDEPPALSGRSTPDPLCMGTADPDGDTIMNASDTDDDDDGFSDVVEQYMSSDELDDCPGAMPDIQDAWPPDAVPNGTANIGDVSFMFGMGKILQAVGQPNYSARSDANGNGQVNVGDVGLFFGGGVILTSC